MAFMDTSVPGFGVILQDRHRKSEITEKELGAGSRDILIPCVQGAWGWAGHSRSCPWHHPALLGPFPPQGYCFIS